MRGGWPGVINLSLSQAKRTAKDYVDAICEIDISSIDNIKRDPQKVRATIRSLARNESSYASINTIEKDAGISISRQTISEYLRLLIRLHVCKDILPWNPALRSPVKIRAAKKRHFADPSLAVSAGNRPPVAKLVVYGFGTPTFSPAEGTIVAPLDALCL